MYTPDYVKFTPSYVNVIILYSEIYNRYVEYFNKNPIRSRADFTSILSGLENTKDRKLKELKFRIKIFKYRVNDEFYKKAKDGKFYEYSELSNMPEFNEKRNNLFRLIESRFDINNLHWFGSKEASKELYSKIINDYLMKLHEPIYSNNYNGECTNELLSVFRSFADLKKIETNTRVIEQLIDNIIESEFPKELEKKGKVTQRDISPSVIDKDFNKSILSTGPEFWYYIEDEIKKRNNNDFKGDILKNIFKKLSINWAAIGIPPLYSTFNSFKASFYKNGMSVKPKK